MANSSDSFLLIIMSADGRSPMLNLQLPSTSTVLDLKHRIALNHTRKPPIKDQRLIFSGKILDDVTPLEQVFQKSTSRTSFMIHLVLDTDRKAATSTSSISTPTTPKVEPVIQQNSTENVSYSSIYEQYVAQLNQYNQQLQQFMMNPMNVPTGIPTQSEAYLQYCHTHYQMYGNLLAHQRNLMASAIPNPSSQTPPNNGPAAAPAAAAAAPPPPAAAVGNNNDLEQDNDILGVLNMMAELFVLCSIIYFYSTFNRFLLVFFIFVLLYLHCRGYLSIPRRRRAPAPAPPVNEPGEPAADNENRDEPINNEASNRRPMPDERPTEVEPAVSPGRLFITAVSTFFSSLIPERPQRA